MVGMATEVNDETIYGERSKRFSAGAPDCRQGRLRNRRRTLSSADFLRRNVIVVSAGVARETLFKIEHLISRSAAVQHKPLSVQPCDSVAA